MAIRAFRGPELNAKGWLQEAALRCLQNNLDPEVAERPDDLIVAIGTQTVHDIREYKKIVAQLTPGEEIVFLVKRKNDLVEVPLTPVLKPTEK